MGRLQAARADRDTEARRPTPRQASQVAVDPQAGAHAHDADAIGSTPALLGLGDLWLPRPVTIMGMIPNSKGLDKHTHGTRALAGAHYASAGAHPRDARASGDIGAELVELVEAMERRRCSAQQMLEAVRVFVAEQRSSPQERRIPLFTPGTTLTWIAAGSVGRLVRPLARDEREVAADGPQRGTALPKPMAAGGA